ncbi:uncharacterized protein [Mytilus edulis]|uniref:uncharacterized protein n=1 Tax=Mytilus edulis TaxID=6550 RepID=UPI0039EF0D3E
MDLSDKHLSLQFYNHVCDIIGSPDVVKTRRKIFTLIDWSDLKPCGISSGSKAEGLDLNGSDYDAMYNFSLVRVYESLNDVQSDSDQIILQMDTNDTKPGFTKLKLVSNYIDSLQHWCESSGEETYISSKLFREDDLPDKMVIHGPCQSSLTGNFDCAKCFRCKEWITLAQPWIHRSRTTWPHYTLVISAIQYGVLFVPIGCKNSPNENLEWRVSFSVTEKMLIHSFPHTQLLCYALMKIILKDIIKLKHGDLLCSYFLKTIMFWLSEEINPSEWKPVNMIPCFLKCMRRLIYCVEQKTCLHYFIPENNLFEDRFIGNAHKALLDTLRFVFRSPCTSLFTTETFLNYRLQSVNSHGMDLSASALSCFFHTNVANYDSCSIYSKFKHFGKSYNIIFGKDMCAYILSVCSRETVQSSDLFNLTIKNKTFYKQYKRIFGLFKISLQSDAVSSWLFLASLLYKCKRFLECIDIIKYCLSSCTPDKILLHFNNNLTEQTKFKNFTQRFGLLITWKYLIINPLMFRSPFSLLPNKLRPLIESDRIDFPPVVYSYVLLFLCYHHIRDFRGKISALWDLELTVKERYLVFPGARMLKTANKCLHIAKALT